MEFPDTDIRLVRSLRGKIERKKEILDKRRPLPKATVSRLREEIRLAHTYNSNAIEGNTLTLQETKVVLEQGITIHGKSIKEHLEATGNAEAFDRIWELAGKKKTFDHVTVQEIHKITTKGIQVDAGRYRTHNVTITGAIRRPPDFSKVISLMDKLLKGISKMSRRKQPILTASYLHYGLVAIHPFSDGNGRVSRLLMNLYLMRYGYPPAVLKKEDRYVYYNALRKADKGNLEPFFNFIASAVDQSLSIYTSIFGGKNELVPLKELALGIDYSQEYLSLRARQGILDAIKIGKVWHSSKRALEEYIAEHGR